MVKCEGPGGAPGTTNPCPNTRLKVRSCQGDIWLCSKCEDKRFGDIDITDESQDKDSILMTNATTGKKNGTQLNNDFAATAFNETESVGKKDN